MCGLYAVLWGKGNEMKKQSQLVPAANTSKESESIEISITSPNEEIKELNDSRKGDQVLPNQKKMA